MLDGFDTRRIETPGAGIHLRIGGSGPPLLLLHGFPQTHACWHRVAPRLAERFTVVCPDLRGYGDSDAPPGGDDHAGYAKRAMAGDIVAVMAALGFPRFRLAGHDRGARVAYRLTLDHPDRVERLAALDIVPTLETVERISLEMAVNTYHWFFLAQRFDVPERLIGGDPDFYLESLVTAWAAPGAVFDAAAMDEYRRCYRKPQVIHATCEDYRAGLGLDCDHDRADRAAGRRIACPMLVLWGEAFMDDRRLSPLDVWRGWADDLRGHGLGCGHFLAEERPEETVAALSQFLA